MHTIYKGCYFANTNSEPCNIDKIIIGTWCKKV